MYKDNEYSTMRSLYAIPGWFALITSILLTFDSIYIFAVDSKDNKKHRKTPIIKYQLLGAIPCLIYFFIGPFLVSIKKSDLACNGEEVLPVLMNSELIDDYASDLPCVLNRGSIYLVMIIFNVIAVHMMDTVHRLKLAKQMKKNDTEPFYIKLLLKLAFIVPMLLCCLMYSMDELDPEYQIAGQVARYMVVCGPRLKLVTEMLIVHIPLMIPGISIIINSLTTVFILHTFNNKSNKVDATAAAPTEPAHVKKKSFKNKQKKKVSSVIILARKLAFFGTLCTILMVTFMITTFVTVPNLDEADKHSQAFIMCQTGRLILILFLFYRNNFLNSIQWQIKQVQN